MAALPTDYLLVRCIVPADAGLAEAARTWCDARALPMTPYRAARQADTGITYVYGRLVQPGPVDDASRAVLERRWREALPSASGVQVSRLQRVFDAPGHSRGEQPAFHYVVEMDPEPGWLEEISRWYDQEHMPGLAAVPGTVHAMRLLNHDHGPLSLACYDLVTQETLGSPAWLAVRGTAWSDIARPHFTNTRRTMMTAVHG